MDYSLLLITEKNPEYDILKSKMKAQLRGVSVKSTGHVQKLETLAQQASLKRQPSGIPEVQEEEEDDDAGALIHSEL